MSVVAGVRDLTIPSESQPVYAAKPPMHREPTSIITRKYEYPLNPAPLQRNITYKL